MSASRFLVVVIALDVEDEDTVEDRICAAISTVTRNYPTANGVFHTRWQDHPPQ